MGITRFDVQKVTSAEIKQIKNPIILYYQQVLHKDSERENLESNVKLRLELELPPKDFFPLPSFYCEKRILLGVNPLLHLDHFLCPHKKLILTYSDIYPAKQYKNLVYECERKMLAKKKTLIIERNMLSENLSSFNKILLGTTMMPKPIVDYVLEYDRQSRKVYSDFSASFTDKKCGECLLVFDMIKKRRVVEQYLFLKYHTEPVASTDVSVSKVWVNAWVEYLFYDSDLYQESTLSKNYCLPRPPITYNFNIRVGDQVQKINQKMYHIIMTIYGEDYLGRGLLEKKDEHLLVNCVNERHEEDIIKMIVGINRAMIHKMIKDQKQPEHVDEWFDFQEEDNVYEITLDKQEMIFESKFDRFPESPGLVKKHSLLQVKDDYNKFVPDQSPSENETNRVKATLRLDSEITSNRQRMKDKEPQNGSKEGVDVHRGNSKMNDFREKEQLKIYLPEKTDESFEED